jgi:hypothetical protein
MLFLLNLAIITLAKKTNPVAKDHRAKDLNTCALGTKEENKVNRIGWPINPRVISKILSVFNSVSL